MSKLVAAGSMATLMAVSTPFGGGVRFVQLYHSTWDDHANLNAKLKTNCHMTDQPAAAPKRPASKQHSGDSP
jgi:hypothetical protein